MIHHALLLLPLAAPPTRPQASQADPEGWAPVDRVEVQAGDEMITSSDVRMSYQIARARGKLSVTTEAQRDRLLAQTMEDLVLTALESQAAEDRDQSPFETEGRLDRFFERQRDQGLVDYVEELQASGMSERTYRERQKTGYYASSFRDQGLHGPRPTRDGYTRPGEMRELHRIQGSALAGSPSYRFQDLVVTADQVGGVEPARVLAEELRQRLLAGEDFAVLHEEYGTTELDTGGVTRLFGPENPMPNPAVRRFAEESEVGAISPVFPLTDRRSANEVVAFRVLVLYERTPAPPPPPFREAETQRLIRESAARNRDEVWLGMARARLNEQAYLWFNDHGAPGDPAQDVAGDAAPEGPQAASATVP